MESYTYFLVAPQNGTYLVKQRTGAGNNDTKDVVVDILAGAASGAVVGATGTAVNMVAAKKPAAKKAAAKKTAAAE